MKFPVKVVWNPEDEEYLVFIEGIKHIEGRGPTEQEALDNFKVNMENCLK